MDIHVSQIRDFKSCRLFHHYGWVQGLVPTGDLDAWTALNTGRAVHYCLARYYNTTEDPTVALKRYFEENGRPDDETAELIDGMLRWYIAWAKQIDDFIVLSVETPVRVLVPHTEHFLVGTLDMLVLWHDRLWVVDHKTCTNFATPEWIELDEQMTSYAWLVWKAYGELPGGVLYDEIRKATPELNPRMKEFFRRTPVIRPKSELEVFERELTDVVTELVDCTLNYPNVSYQCVMWRCRYLQLCRARRQGGDEQSLIESLYRVEGVENEWRK